MKQRFEGGGARWRREDDLADDANSAMNSAQELFSIPDPRLGRVKDALDRDLNSVLNELICFGMIRVIEDGPNKAEEIQIA